MGENFFIPHFVYLSQNGMTQPGSTNDHRGYRLQGKGLDASQVLPGGDWALVLPTHYLATTSLLSVTLAVRTFSHNLLTQF